MQQKCRKPEPLHGSWTPLASVRPFADRLLRATGAVSPSFVQVSELGRLAVPTQSIRRCVYLFGDHGPTLRQSCVDLEEL